MFNVSPLDYTINKLSGFAADFFSIIQNAGMSIGAPSIEEVKLEDFERTIAVNLVAPFNCIKQAFLQMKKQSPQGGRIINNGSISAVTPRPGSAAYTSAKHGITGLTKVRSWQVEISLIYC